MNSNKNKTKQNKNKPKKFLFGIFFVYFLMATDGIISCRSLEKGAIN